MKSSYNILVSKKIVVETLSKTISPNEYSKLKLDEFQDKIFSRTYNLITDLSNFDDKVTSKNLEELFIIFKENKGKFIRNKSALIVSKPNLLETINAIIKNDKKIYKEIKTFSNIDDAYKWVL